MKLRIVGALAALVMLWAPAQAQHIYRGTVVDADTKEPLIGVAVIAREGGVGTSTDMSGNFTLKTELPSDSLTFSYIGFRKQKVKAEQLHNSVIYLQPSLAELQSVVVTGSRVQRARSEEAAALHTVTAQMIQETNPNRLAEIVNKVPGVVMQDLGNEQHALSIRQPMTKRPYFLYLEDGIPIAPLGNFNHNQLIEVNMLGIRNVEVLKGPASSLYGSNAVGGAINFITQSPSRVPVAKVGVQANNFGYRRVEFYAGNYLNDRLGVSAGGYMATQRDGWQEFSDFDKLSLSFKAVYSLTEKIRITGYTTTNHLNTQTGGSIDSAGFYSRKYLSNNRFTYRKVDATRARITTEGNWNSHSATSFTLYYGNNTIGQLPRYRIVNLNREQAAGQENSDSYHNYGTILQHSELLPFLNSRLIAGGSFSFAPTAYKAHYLAISRNPATGYYTGYTARPDSMLANFNTDLLNWGTWLQYEVSPVEKLKLVAGIRYDHISYLYNNNLAATAFSGVPDTTVVNGGISPKVGMIYDLGNNTGMYMNISRGLSAPQTSDLFFGRKVPDLKPAHFNNYEAGGWMSLMDRKMYIDFCYYHLTGFNEIISYRLPNNSMEYRNAGRTLHKGVEYSLTYSPSDYYFFRFGGTNAVHKYLQYEVQEKADGDKVNYNGNYMAEAPGFIANAEATVKPRFAKGLRLSVEWQRISSWYKDDANLHKYEDKTLLFNGVSLLNLRTAYRYKNLEAYCNIMNLTNELYAHSAARGSRNVDVFSAGAPRTYNVGFIYHFSME